DEKVALFPRGSASSGLGGVVPTVKGIVLDLSSLNKIVEPNMEKETVKVQTGVRWSALEDFLCSETLSLRAYPSSFFSTVGGWIATGGYGIGSYRFGHLKDQIESIEVMFPSGEVTPINSKEEEFARFFGTEGQFGIVLSAVLKLRKKTEKSLPRLIYLESAEDAFVFITGLINEAINVNHIKYMDASHLEEINTFFGEDLFRRKDAVLVEFEEEEEATKFRDFAEGRGILGDDYLSNYLWHERLFPMKKRCDKPTPLACEMVIPIANAVSYLKEAKRYLKKCGVDVEVESHIVGKDRALLMLTYMSDVREPKTYLANMALIPVLTRLGLKFGGVPYGIGIWNTPFINDKYNTKTLELYRAYKK
ncbi:MAG: FAD-binding oxidoreductase, partial [Methanophagales archaeon]|nr:FAD-binding oxidoreductase [Methanophagales archaeon]